jgi:hypothetical protein
VCDRSAEGSHHRIADELLDSAAVTLDLLTQARVIGADASPHVLRILLLRGGGEADEVAEEDGDDLALLECPRRRDREERRGALVAELRPCRVLFAAVRADRHEPSLRQ